MSLRRRIAKLGAIVIVVATVGALGAASSAIARSQLGTASAQAAASGGFSCASQQFCDYIYDNGTGVCFKANPFSGIPSDNWSYYGCRNVDGSIYNNTVFTFRVYYGPNHGDPHACIPPYTKVSDLFNYDFNSGSGPHNLVIGNDIASFSFSTSPCTNTPL
jgi:Peptidase inhibitor family I36